MVEPFFTILIALAAMLLGIYSFLHDKKSLPSVLLLAATAFVAVLYPLACFIFVLWIPMGLLKKVNYTELAAMSLFSAILVSFFLFNAFITFDVPYLLLIASISAVLICVFAILGIFEDDLKKFLIISNVIQLLFVVLDLSIAKMNGYIGDHGFIQIFNYTIAGLTLFLALGVLARNKTRVSQLQGSWFVNKWNDAAATIACLSLAGLPAFNMFVAKWVLFTDGFNVSPMIALLGIFAALLMFIMYYKIVYMLLVGWGEHKHEARVMTWINASLAIACVILGLFPFIQFWILSLV